MFKNKMQNHETSTSLTKTAKNFFLSSFMIFETETHAEYCTSMLLHQFNLEQKSPLQETFLKQATFGQKNFTIFFTKQYYTEDWIFLHLHFLFLTTKRILFKKDNCT